MISLCMIVRDEAALLPRFLKSVEGLWDELCVADTGSIDDSKKILIEAGAIVIDFPWIADFSAARNTSLSMATGDWIIYLDPGEFPSRQLIEEIRGLEKDLSSGAASLLMRNIQPADEINEQRLLRIFRRDPRICFEHPIHESAEKSIGQMLRFRQLKLRHLSGHVEHIGYQPSLMEGKNKRQRDQQILESTLSKNPADLYSALKLLELANYWSDSTLSERIAHHLLRELEQAHPDKLSEHHWGAELLARLARTLYATAPHQALKLLQNYPTTPSMDFLETRGLFFEAAGDTSAAHRDFNAALKICKDAAHPAQMQVPSILGLCRLSLVSNEVDNARALVNLAVEINPKNLLALRYDLLIARLTGGEPAIRQRISELGERYGIELELAKLAPEFGLTAAAVSVLTS